MASSGSDQADQWVDDSGEDQYLVELFDAYGQVTWTKSMSGVSGGQPSMLYDGAALVFGMYYQFRVTSSAQGGGSTANALQPFADRGPEGRVLPAVVCGGESRGLLRTDRLAW